LDQSRDLRSVISRIKFVWGSHRVWGGTEIQHWLQHPLVQERINFKVSGARDIIGPSRFQWTDAQLRIINDELRRLPKGLRRLISNRRKVKERVRRKSVHEIVTADPSEAVRSSEILPLSKAE
jgi:hypothetical protein